MIYFLRHGLDDEEYIGGWSDVDLTEEGIRQVNDTINIMDEHGIIPSSIITSKVKRAEHTAKMVSDHFHIAYELSEKFMEQNKGILNGMRKEEANLKFPQYTSGITIDTTYPEGESLKDLLQRIKTILPYINSLDDNTLIVTHRGVINMLYYILNNIPLDMNKGMFGVQHASLHAYDQKKLTIRKEI